MTKRRKGLLALHLLLIALTLAFIWSRSLKSIEESREESTAVLGALYPLFALFLSPEKITDHLIRKTAHFCEFGLLGVEFGSLRALRGPRRIPLGLLIGFFCAAVDENIQYFTGRGNQFSDVMLDFFGYAVGALGIGVLIFLAERIFVRR